MSDISPIQRTLAADFEPKLKLNGASTEAESVSRGQDRVQLSDAAQVLAAAKENPIRQELVDRVKAEINAGTYETPDKYDAALDELLSDL